MSNYPYHTLLCCRKEVKVEKLAPGSTLHQPRANDSATPTSAFSLVPGSASHILPPCLYERLDHLLSSLHGLHAMARGLLKRLLRKWLRRCRDTPSSSHASTATVTDDPITEKGSQGHKPSVEKCYTRVLEYARCTVFSSILLTIVQEARPIE